MLARTIDQAGMDIEFSTKSVPMALHNRLHVNALMNPDLSIFSLFLLNPIYKNYLISLQIQMSCERNEGSQGSRGEEETTSTGGVEGVQGSGKRTRCLGRRLRASGRDSDGQYGAMNRD